MLLFFVCRNRNNKRACGNERILYKLNHFWDFISTSSHTYFNKCKQRTKKRKKIKSNKSHLLPSFVQWIKSTDFFCLLFSKIKIKFISIVKQNYAWSKICCIEFINIKAEAVLECDSVNRNIGILRFLWNDIFMSC